MPAPVNITPPSISGSTIYGSTLTFNRGTWGNDPLGFAYYLQTYNQSTNSWSNFTSLIYWPENNPQTISYTVNNFNLFNKKIRLQFIAGNSDGYIGNINSNEFGPIISLLPLFLKNNTFNTDVLCRYNSYVYGQPRYPRVELSSSNYYSPTTPNLSIQWQISANNSTWSNMPDTYNEFSSEQLDNGLYYYQLFKNDLYSEYPDYYVRAKVILTNSYGSTTGYSNSVQLVPTLLEFVQNPVILKDEDTNYLYLYEDEEYPELNYQLEGDPLSHTTEYQWQVLNEDEWENISGATNSILEEDIDTEYDGNILRLKLTVENDAGATVAYSNQAIGNDGEAVSFNGGEFPILSGYPIFAHKQVRQYNEITEEFDYLNGWENVIWGNPNSFNDAVIILETSEDEETWVEQEVLPDDYHNLFNDDFKNSYYSKDQINFIFLGYTEEGKLLQSIKQYSEFEEQYVRLKIVLYNFKNIDHVYTDSFFMEVTPPGLNENFDFNIERIEDAQESFDTTIGYDLLEKETSTNNVGFGISIPDVTIGNGLTLQWQVSADKLTWRNIDAIIEEYFGQEPTATNAVLIRTPSIETYFYGQWIRAVLTAENEYFSEQIVSNIIPIGLDQISLIESDSTWKFVLYDYEGNALGELVDVNNANLNIGINKNPTLSFDTTLKSPLGELLGNGLNEDEPLLYITAWRIDPYEENLFDKYKLQFSGIVFSTEEKGSDANPTIGVTAVGGHYQLTKRIVNDEDNNGRTESGIKPTTEEIHLYVADSDNNRINVFNTQTGAGVRRWPSSTSSGTGNGQFNNPQGIDIDQNQYVYVADTDNHRIQKFDLEGNFISKWTTASDEDDDLNYPIDVAVDQLNGNVWVADRGNKRVVKFDSDGNFILEVLPVTGCPMDTLRGISTDLEGNAYLADNTSLDDFASNRGVYKITPDGTLVFKAIGGIQSAQKKFVIDDLKQAYWVNRNGVLRRGPGKPELTSKASTMQDSAIGQSVEIGPDKAIYFLESGGGTSKITKYNAANNKSGTIASNGSGNDQILNAKGIALARVGAKDAIEIVADAIEYSNEENDGCLIEPPTSWNPAPLVFIPPGSLGGYKLISSLIEDLNESFEWTVEPRFEFVSGDLKIGKMKIEPVLGSNLYVSDSIVFEYGFGKTNVDEYTIKKSIENMANKINYPAAEQKPYNIGNSNPDLIDKIGVYEDVISGSVLSKDLRKNIVDLHFKYRSFPRLLAEITPSRSDQSGPNDTRTPIPLIEYNVGDIVGIGIQEEDEYRIPPAEARIYDIQIQIDSEGKETATLNLYFDS